MQFHIYTSNYTTVFNNKLRMNGIGFFSWFFFYQNLVKEKIFSIKGKERYILYTQKYLKSKKKYSPQIYENIFIDIGK